MCRRDTSCSPIRHETTKKLLRYIAAASNHRRRRVVTSAKAIERRRFACIIFVNAVRLARQHSLISVRTRSCCVRAQKCNWALGDALKSVRFLTQRTRRLQARPHSEWRLILARKIRILLSDLAADYCSHMCFRRVDAVRETHCVSPHER